MILSKYLLLPAQHFMGTFGIRPSNLCWKNMASMWIFRTLVQKTDATDPGFQIVWKDHILSDFIPLPARSITAVVTVTVCCLSLCRDGNGVNVIVLLSSLTVIIPGKILSSYFTVKELAVIVEGLSLIHISEPTRP